MRQYPRRLYKSIKDHTLVGNETEEIKAGLEGYESHWNPEINEQRKGTDREVLRVVEKEKSLNVDIVHDKCGEIVEDCKCEGDDVIKPVLSPQQKAAITRKKNKEAKING